jgi:hypothetical protein
MEVAQAVTVAETVDRTIHPSGIVPMLQNVVATVNLGCRLDLKEIALHARNAEYNPKVEAEGLPQKADGLMRTMSSHACCPRHSALPL